jgi:hypothetical protein
MNTVAFITSTAGRVLLITGASAGSPSRFLACSISVISVPTAPAGICRMRARCPIPTVNPSFHDRWPNSNANNKQPVAAVNSFGRVMVIIVRSS